MTYFYYYPSSVWSFKTRLNNKQTRLFHDSVEPSRRQRRPTTILFRLWIKNNTRARALSSIGTVVAARDHKVQRWRSPAAARPSTISATTRARNLPRDNGFDVPCGDVTRPPPVARICRSTVPLCPSRVVRCRRRPAPSARRGGPAATADRHPASGVQRQRRWTSGRSLRWGNFFPSLTS